MANIINASPTKEFFIQMLTRDIKLERAIIDLIDNSLDGAKSLVGSEDFTNLSVELKIDDKEFIIKDNCGGFSLHVAKNYAFMFGRSASFDNEIENSVGRFGVGMKRALFKIGKSFVVESKCKDDHFIIEVDVDEWSKKTNLWSFEYKVVGDSSSTMLTEDGTYIRVTSLNSDVLKEFRSQSYFFSTLISEVESALDFSIAKNFKIKINDKVLKKKALSLIEYDNLKSFCKLFYVDNVRIKVIAGLSKPSPDDSGWYIYCNERLVLSCDKTNLTGWDGRRLGESSIVKWHNIYAMFRGIVFFDVEDSKKLPMTTTKTGVDSNSTVFKAAREIMVDAMTQVMTFLKKLDNDEQRDDIITLAKETDVVELKKKSYSMVSTFIHPNIQTIVPLSSNETSISFKANKEIVSKIKTYLNVRSNTEVGLKTFDYFIRMEEIE